MADAIINVIANIKRYEEEFAKLPGYTAAEAKKAAQAYEKEMTRRDARLAADAKRASAAAVQLATAPAEAASEAFEAAHKASEAVGGMFGGLTGPLTDIGDLLTSIGPTAAAAVVGVAGLGAAFVAVAANSFDVSRNLDTYLEQARELGVEVLPAQEAALREASAALVGYDAAWLDLRVTLAAKVAPGLANITDAVAGLATVIGDASASDGTALGSVKAFDDYLRKLPVGIGFVALEEFAQGFADVGAQAREAAAGLAAVNAAREEQAAALLALGLVMDDSPEAQAAEFAAARKAEAEAAKAATEAAKRAAQERAAAAESLASLEESLYVQTLDQYDAIDHARREQMATIDDLEAASGDHATAELARMSVERLAVDKVVEAREAAAARGVAASEAYQRAKEAELAATTRAAEEAERAALRAIQLEEQKAEAARRAFEDGQNSTLAAASSFASALATAADMAVESYDTTTKAGREAALKAFNYAKAFALVDVAIKTAQAIINAFTFPTPVGVALGVAAATVAGATQAAMIASQQPTFHAGLYGGNADEVAAVLRAGEVVVPAPTVMAAGGPQEVRSRVEDGGGGPTVLVADFGSSSVMVPLRRSLSRGMEIGSRGAWRS